MYCRLFLVSALLACGTGESLVRGQSEKVLAFEGGDVILPCSFNITANGDFPNVEWSKEGLEPNVVFLYRDGCETVEMKNPIFKYRTSLILKELKNGNISLRISNVRPSDAGRYQCMRLWKNAPRDITAVELIVDAVSEPKLSVVSAGCGAVTLQCEATFSLSEPKITFLDDQENDLPAEDPKRDEDAGGGYSVRRRMALQNATNSVTCRVHHQEFNLVRDQRILIPAEFVRSCFQTNIISLVFCIGLVFGILVALLLCGVADCVRKKRWCKSAMGQKQSVARQESDTDTSTCEDQSLLSDSIDNMVKSSPEKLEEEAVHVKLELNEQKDTISPLQNKLNFQLCPGVCQLKQPTIMCSAECSPIGNVPNLIANGVNSTVSVHNTPPKSANLPQNKGPQPGIQRQNSNPEPERPLQGIHRRCSSPARLTSAPVVPSVSPSCQKKRPQRVLRSMSDSHTQHDPNHHRRPSMFEPSALLSNRYAPLAEWKDECEQLLACGNSTKF